MDSCFGCSGLRRGTFCDHVHSSIDCEFCQSCNYSEHLQWCYGIQHSSSCFFSIGIWHSSKQLFCTGGSNPASASPFCRAFNREITEERFDELLEEIYYIFNPGRKRQRSYIGEEPIFNFKPKLIVWKSESKEKFDNVREDILSIPEAHDFDDKFDIIVNKITGNTLSVVTSFI